MGSFSHPQRLQTQLEWSTKKIGDGRFNAAAAINQLPLELLTLVFESTGCREIFFRILLQSGAIKTTQSVESSNMRPVIQTEFQPTDAVSRLRFREVSPSTESRKQAKTVPTSSRVFLLR